MIGIDILKRIDKAIILLGPAFYVSRLQDGANIKNSTYFRLQMNGNAIIVPFWQDQFFMYLNICIERRLTVSQARIFSNKI